MGHRDRSRSQAIASNQSGSSFPQGIDEDTTMSSLHLRTALVAGLVGVVLAGAVPARAEDCPAFGHGVTRNAVSPEKGPPLR
jgi:hypothetical protein